MTRVPIVRPAELGALPDPRGVAVLAVDDPVLGVDLRGPVTPVGPRRDDRILVGVGPVAAGWAGLVDDLDLTLVPSAAGAASVVVPDPEASLDALGAAVSEAPRAAGVLAGLLRWSGALPVHAALDAESFAYSTLLGGVEFRRWLDGRGERDAPPDVDEPVLVVRVGRELRLTLNRPERRNAYGRLLRDALVDGLDVALLDESIERVVLTGAGPAFCAGGDLAEFGTTPDLVTAHLVRTRGGAARSLHALRDRVEARLHGACVGAGIELPAFAGRVVASPDTTIRLPEIAMGLIPGAGGTVSIPRRIGRHRTLYLALSGAPLSAAEARDWGLVDVVLAGPL
ncbi:MAG: enoyl-CoA hydratase/isomerase family protein [Pseudonocardia sp.]|uniref:enoyl-CoA hydratase/isomerase family protein n=1 Tax=unclassified Pseudonocardia TaxID=2619320 RepID=UPI000868F0FE|nr:MULTISPECIES: enoyl-CoA hydratase/isomerase family protein [unclassified Pseudonocardia]MBN9107151.1 enoyl-CoA hydratase/isomerase family protein [Pseudonocardia sp.]ODU26364.1 MAG: enoyl-CoA hydratase [Pseudonocardia sp. SCN 72-51]ODV02699.1 MAG: enoyl-CoA hydratase [Pseudonocardia sp. SCN 73-27]